MVIVSYLSSTTDALAAEYSAVAETHRDDYLFGLSTDKDAFAAADITPPAVVVYRNFDEPAVTYPFPLADAKAADFEEWLKELSIPILDEVSGENYAIYASSSKPLAYLFVDPSSAQKDEHLATIKPVAAKYKSKMNFVWIDAVKFGDHAKALNLLEAKWPSFVIQDVVNQLKYPHDQAAEVTAESATQWVLNYLDGALEPALKSQPIPDKQDEPVFTLVGKQFEQVVFDDSKDVFVEFYAPWYLLLVIFFPFSSFP